MGNATATFDWERALAMPACMPSCRPRRLRAEGETGPQEVMPRFGVLGGGTSRSDRATARGQAPSPDLALVPRRGGPVLILRDGSCRIWRRYMRPLSIWTHGVVGVRAGGDALRQSLARRSMRPCAIWVVPELRRGLRGLTDTRLRAGLSCGLGGQGDNAAPAAFSCGSLRTYSGGSCAVRLDPRKEGPASCMPGSPGLGK